MRTLKIIKGLDKIIGSILISILRKIDRILPRKTDGKIKKILLIKFGNIGDVIVTIPAVRAIRRRFPDAEITMLTSNRTKGLYSQYPYIDKVIRNSIVENKGFFQNILFTLINVSKLTWAIKRGKFDLVVDFETYSTFSAFLAFISGAKTRLGLETEGTKRAELFTHKMPYIKEDRHEVDTFLDLISLIGIKTKNKGLEIGLSEEDKRYASDLLKNGLISKEKLLVAIHPGGNVDWLIKRWPKENYIEMISRLIKKYPLNVIIIGSPDEKEIAEEIAVRSGCKLFNFIGETDLNQLAAILSKCGLFICNDSAPMHIASAVNIPIVAIMNYVNPKRWGPYGKGHIALTNSTPENPYWNGYMGNHKVEENHVDVEKVIKAAERQIERLRRKDG